MSNQTQLRTYTPEQVADIYQISKASVYKMIQDGKLLAKKINDRQYRIPQSELEWVTSGLDSDILKLQQKDLEVLDDETRNLLTEIRRRNEKNQSIL